MVRVGQAGARLVPGEKKDSRVSPPDGYLKTLYEVLAYLDSMTEFAPELRKMSAEDRTAYTVGYAAPLLDNGVDSRDLMPAARAYLAVHSNYPKSPAKLLEWARMARDKRLREENANAPALVVRNDAPPVRDETRRAARERLGLSDALE